MSTTAFLKELAEIISEVTASEETKEQKAIQNRIEYHKKMRPERAIDNSLMFLVDELSAWKRLIETNPEAFFFLINEYLETRQVVMNSLQNDPHSPWADDSRERISFIDTVACCHAAISDLNDARLSSERQ